MNPPIPATKNNEQEARQALVYRALFDAASSKNAPIDEFLKSIKTPEYRKAKLKQAVNTTPSQIAVVKGNVEFVKTFYHHESYPKKHKLFELAVYFQQREVFNAMLALETLRSHQTKHIRDLHFIEEMTGITRECPALSIAAETGQLYFVQLLLPYVNQLALKDAMQAAMFGGQIVCYNVLRTHYKKAYPKSSDVDAKIAAFKGAVRANDAKLTHQYSKIIPIAEYKYAYESDCVEVIAALQQEHKSNTSNHFKLYDIIGQYNSLPKPTEIKVEQATADHNNSPKNAKPKSSLFPTLTDNESVKKCLKYFNIRLSSSKKSEAKAINPQSKVYVDFLSDFINALYAIPFWWQKASCEERLDEHRHFAYIKQSINTIKALREKCKYATEIPFTEITALGFIIANLAQMHIHSFNNASLYKNEKFANPLLTLPKSVEVRLYLNIVVNGSGAATENPFIFSVKENLNTLFIRAALAKCICINQQGQLEVLFDADKFRTHYLKLDNLEKLSPDDKSELNRLNIAQGEALVVNQQLGVYPAINLHARTIFTHGLLMDKKNTLDVELPVSLIGVILNYVYDDIENQVKMSVMEDSKNKSNKTNESENNENNENNESKPKQLDWCKLAVLLSAASPTTNTVILGASRGSSGIQDQSNYSPGSPATPRMTVTRQ